MIEEGFMLRRRMELLLEAVERGLQEFMATLQSMMQDMKEEIPQ